MLIGAVIGLFAGVYTVSLIISVGPARFGISREMGHAGQIVSGAALIGALIGGHFYVG